MKYIHNMVGAPEILDRLLQIALLFQQDLARSFEGTPLTSSRVHLLWIVYLSGPSTQAALAAALDVTPRNVTGLVDALEVSGYLERRSHPSDRRAVLVALTALGEETMATMARDREQLAADLVAGMDDERLARFEDDLATIAGRLQELVDSAARGADHPARP